MQQKENQGSGTEAGSGLQVSDIAEKLQNAPGYVVMVGYYSQDKKEINWEYHRKDMGYEDAKQLIPAVMDRMLKDIQESLQ
jgi:tryptophanyl-tRNA synthetase